MKFVLLTALQKIVDAASLHDRPLQAEPDQDISDTDMWTELSIDCHKVHVQGVSISQMQHDHHVLCVNAQDVSLNRNIFIRSGNEAFKKVIKLLRLGFPPSLVESKQPLKCLFALIRPDERHMFDCSQSLQHSRMPPILLPTMG